ncbi:MAG: Ig-like domain-containing protein, partial [Cyanobacteria bacterium J06626_18]
MPTAVNDTATTQEDATVDIDVLGNDADAGGNPLSITAVGPATNGTAASTDNTAITYTPNAGFSGTDAFSYTVTNGTATATATVTVTVDPVNDAPTAGDDVATTLEDEAVIISVLDNDGDANDDPLS